MRPEEFKKADKSLTPKQREVLELFLAGKTEKETAREIGRSPSNVRHHLKNVCGKFGLKEEDEKPGMKHRDELIEIYAEHQPDLLSNEFLDKYKERQNLIEGNREDSRDLVPINLDIYLEPEKLQDCYNKIVESGALIRIKGPHQTGKTLLLNKIMDRADKEGYDLAIVNFAETDAEVLSDYQKLLRWFCVYLGDELDLEDKVDEQFKEVFGNNKNCTNYLERYLLKERSQPLVLALEGVDAVFEVADFNNDFCRLLREWNNAAKLPTRRGKIWQQVRLIIAHSTEVYGELDINSSPLAGVGLTVALSGFGLEQVKQLSQSYGLGLSDGEVRQLMDAFGGHPYLVTNALAFLKNQEFNLTDLLAVAPTEASPFGNHLRELLGRLERQPELAAAYLEVMGQNEPVQLTTNFTFKLESLGLVKVEKDFCRPYCEVYRQYFSSRLSSG